MLVDNFSDPYSALDQKWVSRARQAVAFIHEYGTGDILVADYDLKCT